MRTPPRPNNIGKNRIITGIDGTKIHFTVEDEIVLPQGSGKLIYFQKLRFKADNQIEYRLTYYMLGHKPSRKGQWVFGQFSLMIPEHELSLLLTEARARGWSGI